MSFAGGGGGRIGCDAAAVQLGKRRAELQDGADFVASSPKRAIQLRNTQGKQSKEPSLTGEGSSGGPGHAPPQIGRRDLDALKAFARHLSLFYQSVAPDNTDKSLEDAEMYFNGTLPHFKDDLVNLYGSTLNFEKAFKVLTEKAFQTVIDLQLEKHASDSSDKQQGQCSSSFMPCITPSPTPGGMQNTPTASPRGSHISGDVVCQGAFTVHQCLGSGAFGTVYLVTGNITSNKGEQRKIALKMQHPGKKLNEAALDEVALLTFVRDEQDRLLDVLAPGVLAAAAADSSATVEKAAAAAVATASAAALAAGAECVVRFYGHSIHKGLSGSQVCIEMEALGPSLLELITEGKFLGVQLPLVKVIARDALRGLHFLHAQCGIVHTDIKPENLLLCIGQEAGVKGVVQMQADLDGEKVEWKKEEEEILVKIRAIVYGRKTGWMDVLAEFLKQEQGWGGPGGLRTEIVDLGNSCFDTKTFTEEIQTRQYRSPEVILHAGYSGKADIWSLACTIFELVTGDYLFDPKCKRSKTSARLIYELEEDLLAQHQELIGQIPRGLLQRGQRTSHFFKKNDNLKHISCGKPWPLADVLIGKYGMQQQEAMDLADFLLPMLRLEPVLRASAAEMLLHPWLQN